jgi:glutathione S-transferase
VDYFTGAYKSPEYLLIHPSAPVPSAVYDDCIITESNLILQYAGDLGNGVVHYTKDLKKRADVNGWLLWEALVWFPSCYVYLFEFVVKPLLKTEPDQSTIDAQLAKTKWLVGDGITIADIAVALPMRLHAAQRLPPDQHPNLKCWMGEGIEKLPCWQKTQAAVDKALLPGAAD